MRLIGVLTGVMCVLGAETASAGAWLREEGAAFTAGTLTLGQGQSTTNIYAEYGWRAATTLGFDAELNDGGTVGEAGVFLVKPLGPTDRTARMSWQIGAGAEWTELTLEPYFKGGVSWGRGIQYQEKYGWVAVDSSAKWNFGRAESTIKVDATVGLGLTEKTKGMMQLFLTFDDSGTSAKLAPSLLYAPKAGPLTIQVGAEIPVVGSGDPTLKIGLWRTF